ncbi:GNAT family N-acetyltransferase [bacterium]|nr:GNAT family N-acetyltransferase [bacterium]
MSSNFQTEPLLLRPTQPTDADFLLALFNSPKWMQFIGDRHVRTLAEAEAYIESRMMPQMECLGFSNYTVFRRADETPIGICGLYERHDPPGIELGFALLPEYEKMGYAFEAAHRLLEAARTVFSIKQLGAITNPNNIDSQKLLEKLGFRFVEETTLPGETELVWAYRTEAFLV